MNRRSFLKAIAAGAVVPLPAPAPVVEGTITAYFHNPALYNSFPAGNHCFVHWCEETVYSTRPTRMRLEFVNKPQGQGQQP